MRGVHLMISMVLLIGCKNKTCREAIDPIPTELNVVRIEEKMFKATSSKEVETILQEYPDFARFFLDSKDYPSDAILAGKLFNLIQNPAIDTLYQESMDAFANLEALVTNLEESIGRLKAYYPQTKTPVVYTTVSGLYKDLFITNDHIMIGMDFFVGENATYPPQEIPNYILRRYDTKHLPANVMQFISSQYISPSKGETMLAEMIDHGKSYYLLSKILPCTPEHILMGYTPEEWNDSFENDAIIWANFVENELLYETNHEMKQKFLGERPNVYEIGEKCPGRIGRWLGWQIVNSYVIKTGASVQDLMSETDPTKVFRLSQYKPSGG